jgi:2-keto-4-pentenoate hydratase
MVTSSRSSSEMNSQMPIHENLAAREPLTAMDLLNAYDEGKAIDRAKFLGLTDLSLAENLQARCLEMRLVRGEQPVGMKIGFTNKNIWPLYNVSHPIWAPVYRETVIHTQTNDAEVWLQRVCEPRIEPEIVLGFKVGMVHRSNSMEDVFAALDWVAHGFEIVQSPFTNWKFTAAEAFAAQGLHSQLIIGSKINIASMTRNALAFNQWLAALRVTLRCNGQAVATGRGSDVLDSPLQALCHLLAELDKRNQALPPGAIVSTGTLTDAMPMANGELWETQFEQNSLPNLRLKLSSSLKAANVNRSISD